MGNRAVIVSHDTTNENQTNKIGIYVHWCGSEETVKGWLSKAKTLGVRDVDSDPAYFWARLCQIITDDFSESGEKTLSVGIDVVQHLDTNNWDNGVYYVDSNFEIVKHTDGKEFVIDIQDSKRLLAFYRQDSAGSFHTALLDAWSKADSKNAERLSIGFPALAYALDKESEEN